MRPLRKRKPATSDSRKVVLYVEDADENWEVAHLRLSSHYRLVRAVDDRQACELVDLHRASLYAILMDIELKGSELGGVELTRLLRGDRKGFSLPPYAQSCAPVDIPILFVTAYSRVYTDDQLREAGGDKVIKKPVDFVELSLALASIHLDKYSRRYTC